MRHDNAHWEEIHPYAMTVFSNLEMLIYCYLPDKTMRHIATDVLM